ncbi:uncharacterized protein LOC128999130 isoform X2 [Macrosteles quadrilineatus]|uniref:uncharacterized protein LOC128999130 isoform X2 n=1 Tax=Macrosteles quadrilineatus TaxID=74068 RepID=UPI0023E2EE8C|nr:uncharacterized protein LOC128999130 isoform X2 [Macrosteles quadrilineatus]
MPHFTFFLLLSGTALSAFVCVQGNTRAKRSADNPLSSFGDGWQSQISEFTSNLPVKGPESFGVGNLPGLNQASGAAAPAEKAKRSADNPLSSFGDGWQSQISEFTSNLPVKGPESFGVGNLPGLSQASGAAAPAEKAKRSADNPLSSFGDGWQSQISEFTSNLPVKGPESFGVGNLPGLNQASGAAAPAEKAKRSADNPLSSFGDGWQSQISEFTSNLPVKGPESFGVGNLPGLNQASGAAAPAEKAKRSADNPLSSFGDGWQSQISELTSNLPVKGPESFGVGNLPGLSQASGAAAPAEKAKRSADNPLSSFGDGWQSQISEFTSNLPVKGPESFGVGNLPGLNQASGAAAPAEKAKRSADNPLSSFGDGWQSQISEFTSNLPVKGPESFGVGNLPGLNQASGAAAPAEKAKRSADNPLSSFGDGWQSQISEFTSNLPVKGPESFGVGNLPGLNQASGAAAPAEKAKRSADNPLSSFGDGWQSQISELTSNLPVKGPESFGVGNLPGLNQASGAAAPAEKAKRSADNPLSSFGDGWQSQISELTSNLPVKGPESFGVGNLPGLNQASGAAAPAEKAKRSADNPLSSFGDGWQSQISEFTSNLPVKGPESFGVGNLPGLNQASGAAAPAEKAKRSADNPLSSFGDGWQSQISEFTSNLPVKGPESFGVGNLPGLNQASGAAAPAEKAKRSADNPLSSFGDGWQSQISEFTSNLPVKGPESFGVGNLPGLSQASGAAAPAEKAKRSADNPLSSFGDGWQSQISEFTSNLPVKGPESFGVGNLPGLNQASGAAAPAEKAKRSADNPLSSFGDGWQSQISEFTSNLPVKGPESFGVGNLPGLNQASGAAAPAEKSKRSSQEYSWTDKLKNLFTGGEA